MSKSDKRFTAARARIAAQGVVLKQAREGGFNAGENALGGIYNSLGTTLKGVKATLSADNQRRVEALGRIQNRAATRAAGTVAGAQAGITNRYGSAMGLVGKEQLKPAGAAAREIAGTGRAATRAGKMTARGENQALGIEQSAASASRSSADYAMATALQYRAKNDASLIAQEKTTLATQRMQDQHDMEMLQEQHKLDMADWVAQQEYAQKKLDEHNIGALGQITGTLPGVGVAMEGFASGLTAAPMVTDPTSVTGDQKAAWAGDKPSALELASYMAQQSGITDPADPRTQLYIQMATLIVGGMPAVDAERQVMQTAYGSLPGYDQNAIDATLRSGTKVAWNGFTPSDFPGTGGSLSDILSTGQPGAGGGF